MDIDAVTCRVRLQLPSLPAARLSLIPFYEHTDITTNTRRQWAEHLMKTFNPESNPSQTIRPLDIILFPDGTSEIHYLSVSEDIEDKTPISEDKTDHAALYPAPYRIPPHTIADLGHRERIRRAECFALGSVLYELFNNSPPFAHLLDETIQQRFSAAEFPKNVLDFPKWPIMLSCWSLEFAAKLRQISCTLQPQPPSVLSRLLAYPKNHPYRFALQSVGVLLGTAALACPPLLAAAGFSALGPVAGSGAAAWQASIGAVEAGSLFAWCQSAAMGGAALNGVFAAGAAGAGMVGAGVVGGMIENDGDDLESTEQEAMKLRALEMFREGFRKGSDTDGM